MTAPLMVRARAFAREVLASAFSQRVTSVVTFLLVLGATATVLVTAGRNAGAQAAVLAQVDAAGTRSLTVYAQGVQPAFTSAIVPHLAAHDDVITEVVGFGPVTDVTAAAIPVGTPVGMRTAYGTLSGRPLAPGDPIAGLTQTWATPAALDTLGMPQGRGSVRVTDQGRELLVTDTVTLPEHLEPIEPAVITPGDPATNEPLTSLVVIADRPQDLPLVTDLVTAALTDVPPDGLKIESSQAMADLRAVIGGKLTAQSRSIILGVLAAAAAATLVNVWSLALMRRRDFGRRRALGATRTMIVALMTGQVLILAAAGATVGAAAGAGFLAASGDPIPTHAYLLALMVAFTMTTTLIAAIPATWAARRDPLSELRVP